MKLHWNAFAVSLVLAALAAIPVWAQRRGHHRVHMGAECHRYDAAAEVTLKGTVDEVKEVECDTCGMTGTHLMLKTAADSMEVMLGPTAFLKERGITLAQGDEIEVTGAKIKTDGKQELLAREVKKGNETFTLRDRNGRPMWAGKRARRR